MHRELLQRNHFCPMVHVNLHKFMKHFSAEPPFRGWPEERSVGRSDGRTVVAVIDQL